MKERTAFLVTRRGCMLLIAALTVGCASSSDVAPRPESKPLKEHEKTFDPGAYREPPAQPSKSQKTSEPIAEEKEIWVERKERVMGYRIQLYSTTSVDEAQMKLPVMRRRLDSLSVSPGRLDMSFDAPYYKIRLGDFLSRPPADSLSTVLKEHGMTDAWVVRDHVIKRTRVRKE